MLSDLWDKHFVLANDLDFTGLELRPLGNHRGSAFSGTFDGNSHVIHNVTMDLRGDPFRSERVAAWNVGLFGYLTGQVKNLALDQFRLFVGPDSRRIGALAGTCEGRLENCRAVGLITAGESSDYIGELVGYNTGEIVDCESTACITAGTGSTHVGGQVGWQPGMDY